MKPLLLLGIFASLPAFGMPSVVHGTPVGSAQPIHQAIVRFPTADGQAGCTGTLIAPRIAVTAGHCVRGGFVQPGSRVQTVARPGEECSRASVLETAFAPGAEPDGVLMLPDIALVRLDGAPCGTVPAELPSGGAISPGDELTAAGFGIGADDLRVPEQLRLRILPQTKAALLAEYAGESQAWASMISKDFDKFSPYYLFALPAADYGTVCGGDSGGPVFTESNGRAVLFGENGAFITHPSKGIPACDGAYLQLFTPLAPYRGWIDETLRAWGG